MRSIMLGTDAARESLEATVRGGADEVEILDSNGSVVAHLIPAPRPGDGVYAAFQELFLKDQDELLRRQASSQQGKTTAELLEYLQSMSPLMHHMSRLSACCMK